ncbi:hypothetical protein [Thalassobius sp. Cn5-15]|uniref:hypothetical protein n=1 Tax=Thalassobius sp. Cn5-15 TaxID=2917763 RepID=UPI001EF3A24E|nr:hypothetical protein [Thalassobius sp. Cn5-15]
MASFDLFSERATENAAQIMYRPTEANTAPARVEQLIADLNTHQEQTIKICIELVKLGNNPEVRPTEGIEFVPCYGRRFLETQVFNFDQKGHSVAPTIGLADIAAGRGDQNMAFRFMVQSGFDSSVLARLAEGEDFISVTEDVILPGDWQNVPAQVGTQIPQICSMIRCAPSTGLRNSGICDQCLRQSAAYFQPLMTPDQGPKLATELLKRFDN